MKKLVYGSLFLALVGVMIIGCQKEEISNPMKTTVGNGYDDENITQRVQNSEDYLVLMKNQEKSTNKSLNSLFKPFEVDWLKPKIIVNEAGGYTVLFNVYDKNDKYLKGNLIAIIVENKIKVFYESFHELYLNNNVGNINYYYRTLESKMRVGVTINEKGEILIGNDIDLPIASGGWWDCTTNCYHDASNACAADPECHTLCDIADIVNACTSAILIACGIHCL